MPAGKPGPAPIGVLVPTWLMQELAVPRGLISRLNKLPFQGFQVWHRPPKQDPSPGTRCTLMQGPKSLMGLASGAFTSALQREVASLPFEHGSGICIF